MSEDEFSKTSRLRFGCADAPEYPKDAASRISRELPPVDLYAVPAGCCAGDSDPGRIRPQNEDSYLICTRPDALRSRLSRTASAGAWPAKSPRVSV